MQTDTGGRFAVNVISAEMLQLRQHLRSIPFDER
jgi:hypothetical protein